MTTTIYGTQVTAYYLAAVAAFEAGGPALNIAGGTLHVGDGNGSVPTLSALIAANDVTHQVWSGAAVTGVYVDSGNPDQLDIACDIPAAIGGVEIGPFTVTEFAIFDALGNCCVVGTTNINKTVSGSGMTTDLAFIAAIVYGVAGAVTVTPPTAGYATMSAVIAGFNANLPTVIYPLEKTDATVSGGWIDRTFSIVPAQQPADPVLSGNDAASMGSARPASAAEFAALAPTAGRFAWPYPTLQQIAALQAQLTTKHLHVQKQRNVTTSPPALTSTFQAWTLNTVLLNEISGASLNTSTGQITLPAGKYRARYAGMASGAGRHLCRLTNVTLGTNLGHGLVGDSASVSNTGGNSTNASLGEAVFTLTTTTVIQLEHADLNPVTGTFGDASVGVGGLDYDAYMMIETC